MLDSPMIDVALGLMLFFLVMALAVTAIQGWISNFFKLRGNNLRKGIERLTNDEITKKIYEHPLMKTMGDNPSYLKSEYFSKILIDVIDPNKEALKDEKKDIKAFIDKIPSNNLKKIFRSFNTKADDLENQISDWFDTGMERASGWYQKKMQFYSIVISAVLVFAVNADALKIAEALFHDDALRAKTNAIVDQISKQDPKTPEEQNKLLQDLKTQLEVTDFPIGWNEKNFSWDNAVKRIKDFFWYHFVIILLCGIIVWLIFIVRKFDVFSWKKVIERIKDFSLKGDLIRICLYGAVAWSMIIVFWTAMVGWFITISAVSLGAPFWFGLIGKVVNIRNSIKPKEEKKDSNTQPEK